LPLTSVGEPVEGHYSEKFPYRSQLPYDASGNNHAARLTIDLAAGDRWLIALCREATIKWLTTSNPVLDYANAMVTSRQPSEGYGKLRSDSFAERRGIDCGNAWIYVLGGRETIDAPDHHRSAEQL
jgi:hypothetical protein